MKLTSDFGICDEADSTSVSLLGQRQRSIKDIAWLVILKRHVQKREGAVVLLRPGSGDASSILDGDWSSQGRLRGTVLERLWQKRPCDDGCQDQDQTSLRCSHRIAGRLPSVFSIQYDQNSKKKCRNCSCRQTCSNFQKCVRLLFQLVVGLGI